jgi:hypothetical protein
VPVLVLKRLMQVIVVVRGACSNPTWQAGLGGYQQPCDSLTTRAAISAKYVLCRRDSRLPAIPRRFSVQVLLDA